MPLSNFHSVQRLSLPEYLAYIGMPVDQAAQDVPCEVCGNSSSTIIRDTVEVQNGLQAMFKVVACNHCSFLFQNPRFDAGFYDAYYNSHYRRVLSGTDAPGEPFIQDQITRGEYLFASLSPFLTHPGKMLDVGCSAGGIMQAFLKHGWQGFGTDPDSGYVRYGLEKLNMPIALQRAEDMQLAPHSYDLIVITGSLEHVFDPNKVLAICQQAAKPGALLLLEGRGLAQARQVGHCGHNHRRYLTATSIEHFMRKYGWDPFLITEQELCGPSRPQSIFGLGRLAAPPTRKEFQTCIAQSPAAIQTIQDDFARWAIQ